MKNKITILLNLLMLLLSISIFSQKINHTPSIINPFQIKKGTNGKNVLAPKTNDTIKKSKLQIENHNGSFYVDLSKENKTTEQLSKDLNSWFNLDNNHSFVLLSSKPDELNLTHNYYQQYYKNVSIEGAILMLHAKNEIVYASNGQIAQFDKIEVVSNISVDNAVIIAKEHLKVTDLINTYPVETLIAKIPNGVSFDYKYAHRVRIDSSNPFVMANVYIDANNGTILNTISLVANCMRTDSEKVIEKKPFMPFNLASNNTENTLLANTPATANTMYSGTQSIITDSFNGSFRLRDNIRKIETYDATNAVGNSTGYSGALDYFNNTTVWGNAFVLKNFVINNVSQGWWFNSLADQQPDLYIKIKDGNNNIVYNGRNYKKSDTIPSLLAPIAIPLFVVLNNPPYVAELWDFDPVGGDDFGGSYPIISTSGNWTGNGNSGNYIVESINGNPAIDAHWGAEKSHDFFQDIFGRNGFDANGGLIKQYINIAGQPKDNAFASASATNNILGYGLGDGLSSNPWVALDLTGHEFSHLVVAYRQNLNTTLFHTSNDLRYQGESGALNESFADIFGTAIEFHTKPSTANWTLFEDLCLPFGAPESFIRSMSNPNSKEQPDTVNGTYWTSTAGVHTLSGVQNYWFYLLSQGSQSITNPVNDLGNPYSVTGIGISKARQIAYKNLTTYMPSNTSTYMDSYFGSLLAAQELYGNPSPEYSAVRNAWYAVGLGNNPNFSCSGTTNLTASSGTFTDGSNNANYGNNSTCKWVIAPAGATQISLNFTAFNTEALYDFVRVYNGPDDTFPLLGTYSGNTLPSTISTTAGIGAMCVKFTTDTSNTFSGWSANYTSLVTTPACTGLTKLTTPTGTFSDGSGSNNYTNNQQCLWYIAPPCATSVTLTFSTFNTELNFDGVAIYNSLTATTPIATYSGTSLPVSVTSTTGVMLVAFITDYSTSSQGFSASYTSTGSSFCSGTTTLNTADFGTISDGSGTNNYCNNSNCSWLIQPPNATSITLNFTAFDLEQPSTDGNSIYDVVEIYDGTSASATLLEKFTGSNIPQSVTSTGGSMFIKFTSDISDTFQGWSANYTSTQNSYCNASATTLTSPTGTFTDGSGVDKYANNSDCSWLIQPTNARSITLSFSAFDTELNYDGVIVFDGANSTAPVIGQFTGTTLPSSLTSTGGSMYVLFLSDETLRSNGWNANYNSSTLSSDNFELNGSIIIHPNPTSSKIFITSKEHVSSYEIYNALGQKVQEGNFNAVLEQEELDLTALQNGLYILNLKADNLNKTIKVIKQ